MTENVGLPEGQERCGLLPELTVPHADMQVNHWHFVSCVFHSGSIFCDSMSF